MALNALQADMVRFTGTPGIEANGITVGYKAEYTPRTSTDPKYNRLIDNKHSSNIDYSGQYYVQLGEELYNGDLTKKHVTDDFERPSYNWQFKGKEIGTYVDYTVLVNGGTFTEAVKYSELYELLTYTTIDDNDVRLFVDGVEDTTLTKSKFARSNKDEVGGQGVLTEVFVDRDRELVTISCINTYLAQANSDYNSTNETLSLKVYQTSVSGTTKIVDVKDVPEAANVVKDDYRLVYLSGKDSPTNYEVVRMFNVDIMADSTVTKWSKADAPNVVDKLTTGGTEYKSNDKAFYDRGNVFEGYDKQLLTDTTYNIYMDRYGNVIGVDLYEGTKNYVFITGYDRNGSNIAVNTATAAGIFTDGTMSTITVNVTDTNKNIDRYNTKYAFSAGNGNLGNSYFQKWNSTTPGGIDGDRTLNRWYTYTVTNSGVYTLKPVERSFYTAYTNADDGISDANPKVLNSANLYVDDDRSESYTDAYAIASTGKMQRERAYGNDDSIYITVSGDEVDTSAGKLDAITEVDGVYTGAQNVKLELTPGHKNPINTTTGKASEKDAYVYTVYDNKYYIVASIVIGEAQGANANYAYILSDAKNERIEREGDARANGDVTYYWEFDAVVNGEKTTLTAKSRYANVFNAKDVEKYTVRELRYDGEYVVGVKAPDASDYHTDNNDQTGIDKKDIYDIGNLIGQAGWSSSNVMDSPASDVIASSPRVAGTIELVGRTLYVDPGTGRGVGLALASDAKAVLIQPENGDREVTSCGSVSEALGRLADRSEADGMQFKGRVVAVLKDGIAQWVVIISDTNLRTGNRPNYNQTSSVTFGNIRIEVYGMGTQNVTGYINADGDLNIVLPTTPTLARAIPDNYDVDVYVNGALIGTILTPSAQSTDGKTVTYTLTGAKLTATNMQIVARVYPEGSTDPKPPVVDPTKPVSAVTMTKVPADSVKVGDALTATTSTAGVTVKVEPAKADKAGDLKVVITLTTSNEKGFDEKVTVSGATGWTVASVAGSKNAITLTKTIKVTDDGSVTPPAGDLPKATETGGTITLPYYKTAPTADEAKAKIQADLPDLGVTSVMGKAPTYTAYKADGTPLTITLQEQIKVTLGSADGTVLGYVQKSNAGTVNAPDKTKVYIVPNAGKVYAGDYANKTEGGAKISIASSASDVVVYEAVKLDPGSGGVALANLKVLEKGADGITTSLTALTGNPYVKVDEVVYVQAASGHSGEYTGLTMNGETVEGVSVKDVGTDGTLYQYTTKAKDMVDGKIIFKEVVGKKVVIKVGATETPVGVVSSTGAISVASSFADATKGTIYVPVMATTAWESAADKTNVVELTRAIGTDGNTVIAKGTMNANVYAKAVDGVITLVPAAKVTAGTDADFGAVKATFGTVTANDIDLKTAATKAQYIAVGTKLEIASKASGLTAGQFIGITVGTADVVAAANSVPAASATTAATGEYTIVGTEDVGLSLETPAP